MVPRMVAPRTGRDPCAVRAGPDAEWVLRVASGAILPGGGSHRPVPPRLAEAAVGAARPDRLREQWSERWRLAGGRVMSLQMGIIGLPNVGKSTLLNGLTHAHAEASNYPFCTIDRNVGAAPIDDPRLARLAQILKPAETILASIRFTDIAGLVRGASKGEGLGNQFLGHIREADALVHVVRCFEDEKVIHIDGGIDPVRDFEVIDAELMLADLDTVARHRTKINHAAKGNPKQAAADLAVAEALIERLKRGVPLRRVERSGEESQMTRELFLLSAKPMMVVANVAEDDPEGISPAVARLRSALNGEPLLPLPVRLEEEVGQLDPAERDLFLRDLGLPGRGLDRLLPISRDLLHLITFYTTANEKLQAWLIPRGTKAPRAAGRVHSDMETGFIRMEVVRLEDLEEFPTRAELHKHGRMRIEGKEYEIQDGDVCHVLFHAA
jgi:ribosome-binding ATPase